jgi:hypothetical protein
LSARIRSSGISSEDYLFPSRLHSSPHLSTRQFARIVRAWIREIGLDASAYGTHTLRRTKASSIYRRTKICASCSCCWATRSWKARCVTSESKLTMRWRSPNRLRCSGSSGSVGWRHVRSPTGHSPSSQPVPQISACRSFVDVAPLASAIATCVLGGQSLPGSTGWRSLRNAAAGAHAAPRRTPGTAQPIPMI